MVRKLPALWLREGKRLFWTYRYRRAGVYAAGKLEAVMDEAAARLVEQPDAEKFSASLASGD